MRDVILQIARKHNAERVYVFGSCARKEETPESDVDLLVDFNQNATLFDQVDIQDEMNTLLDCKVDVVSRRGLHPYIRRRVLAEAIEL
jgi:predicted nucleotidyltransferase